MRMNLFRKPSDVRQQFHRDTTLAEALVRRVNAIDFLPSKGFLKDQWQQKRSPTGMQLESLNQHPSDNFSRRVSTPTPS